LALLSQFFDFLAILTIMFFFAILKIEELFTIHRKTNSQRSFLANISQIYWIKGFSRLFVMDGRASAKNLKQKQKGEFLG